MQIPILGKLILLFALYFISDLSIKRNILKKLLACLIELEKFFKIFLSKEFFQKLT
tara:strand:+ start:36 stop:203 length:168 start_codon:yes stop_codon:yes gene_type:complete